METLTDGGGGGSGGGGGGGGVLGLGRWTAPPAGGSLRLPLHLPGLLLPVLLLPGLLLLLLLLGCGSGGAAAAQRSDLLGFLKINRMAS